MDDEKDRGIIPVMVGQEAATGTTLKMDEKGRAYLDRLPDEQPQQEEVGSVPGASLTGPTRPYRASTAETKARLQAAAQKALGGLSDGSGGGMMSRSSGRPHNYVGDRTPAWLKQYMREQELADQGSKVEAEMAQAFGQPIAVAGSLARQGAADKAARDERMGTKRPK